MYPIDNPLKKSGKSIHMKNLGKNVHLSRLPDIHYPNHQISGRLLFQTNPEAKNAGLILLKNVLFTLNFSLLWNTLVLIGSISAL